MLQRCRVCASRVAAITLVWMGIVSGTAVVPHEDDCHDAACYTIAIEHDAAAHRVGRASADADHHQLHCLVCHWARSFRPYVESRIVPTPSADSAGVIVVPLFAPSVAAPVAQPPLRSPPSSPIPV